MKESFNKTLEDDQEKKKKKRLLIWVVLLLLLLLLSVGGVLAAMNWSNWFGGAALADGNTINTASKQTPDIDPNAKDKDDTPAESVPQSGIAIPGFKTISLVAGTKEQRVSFENPDTNNCYFVMTLMLKDGTELYKSKMVSPGKGIYEITTNKALSAGTYEKCLLKYECFRIDDTLTPLNGANIDIDIIVQ